jgi:hypothetical protein
MARKFSTQAETFGLPTRSADWTNTLPKHLNPAQPAGAQWDHTDPEFPHVQLNDQAGAYLMPTQHGQDGYANTPQGSSFTGTHPDPEVAKIETEKLLQTGAPGRHALPPKPRF